MSKRKKPDSGHLHAKEGEFEIIGSISNKAGTSASFQIIRTDPITNQADIISGRDGNNTIRFSIMGLPGAAEVTLLLIAAIFTANFAERATVPKSSL